MVNMTCPTIPDKPADPKPFFENGQIDFKAHDVGWLVCGIMALIATISSVWLIWKHLTYYTCPQQQRHIVRLLVMVPIYAIVSFMSYLFYQEALYYQTIRDCYEAVLVTSFFYLILAYTGDTRAEQHAVFRNIDTKGRFWFWPLGSWKYRPEGLHFLWLMKICVLQYAIIRPLCTFVAVGTEYFGYYCLHSWMPWFTHVWCAFFISVSVTVAMYCLIQLYMPVRKLVDPYKPVLKFLAIKTIVFLTFWQDTLLSFLVSFNAIKETEYFTAEQIQAGINALLQCFWMLLFGFIHIKAFSYLPYRPQDRSRTTLRGKAMLDVLDFRDWFVEMKESTRYIAARSKGRNYTLAEDLRAKRHEHLLNALGKQRTANLDAEMDMEKAAMPTFWKNPEDAQFWTPGDESDSDLSGKHANGEGRSSTPLDKAGSDSHTALPNADSRAKVRSELVEQSNTMASRDSHASRAAELQRLVAELDLQDVDQSIVGAEDHDYGYEDERYERAALMHSRHSQPSPGKSGDTPTKELDVHPELTQYHTPTIQLANVPSLTYDQETSSGSVRRGQDLSAVAEEEEDEGSHVRHGSKVGAGIGAFGIAAWLGWSSSVHEAQPKPQPQQQQQQVNAGGGVANDYLRPGDSYAGQQYGADRSPDVDGTGWWRNYWDRVSNAGSREPSIAGMEDEKEPLQTARPAVMRQVTAGSWGLDSVQPVNQQRALPAPPTLKIETNAAHHNDTRGGDGSVDSATSPRISPHVDSPLSRLIQTSRDSFSSLSRDEVREQLLASPSKGTALSGSSISVRKGSLPAVQAVAATRPAVAPRNPSVAPSSNQASVSRVTSTTTRSGPAAPAATKSSTAPSASAYESAVQEMLSSTDTASSKHPIVFVDALLPGEPAAEPATTLAAAVEKTKALPPAVGPKGKLFNLVLPSPLSPARYPYGQEGPTVPSSADQDVTSPVSRREASGHAARQPSESADPRGGGTLKWASQPARPPKPSESVDRASAKLPSGKGIITVGGMSLVQAKAAAQAAAEAEAEAEAQRTIRMEKQEKAAVVGPTKSILSRPTEESKAEGKLVLPAPSQLASVEREDPYAAVASHAPGASGGGSKLARVGRPGGSVVTSSTMQTRTSISGTSFEVGHIVPRDAVVRASLPSQGVAGVPLKSYYDSIRGSQGRGSQGGRQSGGQQRHSYAPSVRPGMLPAHPSQLAAQSPQYHQQRIQQQQPWAAQHPPPPSFASAPTPAGSSFFRPAGPPHEPHVPRSQQLFHHHHYYHHHHQQQQQQQQQWTTPNHHTNSSSVRPQYPQAGQPRGQFQFEYYND